MTNNPEAAVLAVGLTGGISSGKSAASRFLEQYIAVFDADILVHELYRTKQPLRDAISREFGEEYLVPEGVDRVRLRGLVFSNPEKLACLKEIVKPFIKDEIRRVLDEYVARKEPVVLAIPLLFEAGWENEFDHILLIAASREQQIQRCLKRGFRDHREIESIIGTQLPLEEKKQRSNACIENNGSLEELHQKLKNWLNSVFPGRFEIG